MSDESASNRILTTMLDRLYAAILSGPAINCRPNASRQRIDLTAFERLQDLPAGQILTELLSERAVVSISGKVPAPPQRSSRSRPPTSGTPAAPEDEPSELQQQRRAHTEQQALLSKLRILADEAQTYQQDTGAHVLYVGYPLLSLPSSGGQTSGRAGGRQVLAPLAFIPVDLTVRTTHGAGVEIRCREDEVDRVIPNESLLAWVERQTGREVANLPEDESGKDPWGEIRALCEYVTTALNLELPAFVSRSGDAPVAAGNAATLERVAAADVRSAPCLLPSAVLGLFPTSKQGLLRDTKAMIASTTLAGPVQRFLTLAAGDLGEHNAAPADGIPVPGVLPPGQRRLVTRADPCQARAVAAARHSDALVIHGPPGTGKSQTITNIIADHLARGERVLFVCDKRTALDVVANRLDHLGLGSLCALVHDAQRDQRDLYRSIREQIEGLADTKVPGATERAIEESDAEIARIRDELTRLRDGLMNPVDSGDSVHQLVGRWLEATLACHSRSPAVRIIDAAAMKGATLREFDALNIEVQALLRHAVACGYSESPWAAAVGVSLQTFLALPMESVRTALSRSVRAAVACDSTLEASIPPFLTTEPLEVQAEQRERLALALGGVLENPDPAALKAWLTQDAAAISRGAKSLADIRAHIDSLRDATPDHELLIMLRESPPTASILGESIAALDEYLAVSRVWHAPFHFGKRAAANRVLKTLGLGTAPETADRARSFLTLVRSSLIVRSVLDQFEGAVSTGLPDITRVGSAAAAHGRLIDLLHMLAESASIRPLNAEVVSLLESGGRGVSQFIEGLKRSRLRADSIVALEQALNTSGLFEAGFRTDIGTQLRAGRPVLDLVGSLADRVSSIENVLRVKEALQKLPPTMAGALGVLVAGPVEVEGAMLALRQGVLASETRARLEGVPEVATLDPHRIDALFIRWRELDSLKHVLVRDSVLAHWLGRQRSRLLAMTGSRLNGSGAELRRRVSSRGTHALRLRQVLELGRGVEGGDPLLDLRPVWMASPETVAQIFPRECTFDIVIFDEASQCRLEEALPVIMRARRVVVAGDPKQLPPSRFFEDSSLSESESDEIESDQDLFEQQQSEVEDLLSAALNLDLEQTYLDVHYRSRNADLIEFSNEMFYGSRLQAIPGHPANRVRYAPLTLYNVAGVYENRTNATEADQIVKIIRDLLRRAAPPSIGVGCFNIAQRDLIVERLNEAAAADAGFGAALAAARVRVGEGSFEGLFVKNLENVQGDERDHIIISTTYGPDRSGRFYRRFGPLAMPGGGRRLNVLVTRARCEVHLVSSIPPSVYRALPPVEPGQVPGGGWLLFSYLNYAERLAHHYARAHGLAAEPAEPESPPEVTADVDASALPDRPVESDPIPRLKAMASRNPSLLAMTMGEALVRHTSVSGTVHWGNDGFCVDVALDHPTRTDDVTIGVLTDFARFDLSGDHVEWDWFSTAVLKDQGWELERVWSPALFRDLEGHLNRLAEKATTEAAKPPREPM